VDAAPVNPEPGARVRVIDGEHRGRVGQVLTAPSATGTIYLRARVSPTHHALLAVHIDQIEPVDRRGASGAG
jgi:hypothetical protein